MLAPIDKLERGGNNIIQIEITRKCNLNCSNCTRLLAFRDDTVQMSLDVFRKAVESLRDWPGVVAVFGGNPCAHAHFPEMCRILAEVIPPERRGLWTNNLLHHGQIAAETFSRGVLNLNAHGDSRAAAEIERWFPGRMIRGSDRESSWHSAIMVSYWDLGISEQQFVERRERCDINQKWSGIIQERDGKAVAYFCEVAGAIESVTGAMTGVEVYPGWWRERMPTFAAQVKNCEQCGVCHRLRGHLDRDETYDVGPSWRSFTPTRKTTTIVEVEERHCADSTRYIHA